MRVFIVFDREKQHLFEVFSSREKANEYITKNNFRNSIIIVKTVDDNVDSECDTDEADTTWQEEDKKYINMKYKY